MTNKNIQLMDTTGNNLFPAIADSSVVTNKLKDKSVTTAKLADDVNTVINNIKSSITTEANTARAAEKANKDAINILNGDSNTVGSVKKAIADLIGGAPEAYNTLKEIADYIAQDKNAGAALTKSISDETVRAKAAEKTTSDSLTSHTGNKSNPHGVTKAQVGLGNVDNTSDANKPVSTATQNALNGKVDKVSGKSLVADSEITKLAGLKSQEDITKDIKAVSDALNAEITRAEGREPYVVTVSRYNKMNDSNNYYRLLASFKDVYDNTQSTRKACIFRYSEKLLTFPCQGLIVDATNLSFKALVFKNNQLILQEWRPLDSTTTKDTEEPNVTSTTTILLELDTLNSIASNTNNINTVSTKLTSETNRAKAAEQANATAITNINNTLSSRITYKEI